MEELLSRSALVQEGSDLRHCAASYAWSVGRGAASIWSLSRQGEKVLTIEVHNPTKVIRQIRGLRNRLPIAAEVAVVQKWAQEAGLQVTNGAVRGW